MQLLSRRLVHVGRRQHDSDALSAVPSRILVRRNERDHGVCFRHDVGGRRIAVLLLPRGHVLQVFE